MKSTLKKVINSILSVGFISGIASVFGIPINASTPILGNWEDDVRAVANDWKTVGQDILNAYEQSRIQ